MRPDELAGQFHRHAGAAAGSEDGATHALLAIAYAILLSGDSATTGIVGPS